MNGTLEVPLSWSLIQTQTSGRTQQALSGNSLSGRRFCGTGRIQGGVYVESNTAGCDLTPYLIDSPDEIDPQQFGFSSQGMTRFQEEDGSVHFIDRVGMSHYPSVQDFLLEASRMGLSRRIPRGSDFRGLDERSTLILMHNRAAITNAPDYSGLPLRCPTKQHRAGESCLDLHRFVSPDGEHERGDGALRYSLEKSPTRVNPQYAPAFFLRVPITAITVVRGGDSAQVMAKLAAQGVQAGESDE